MRKFVVLAAVALMAMSCTKETIIEVEPSADLAGLVLSTDCDTSANDFAVCVTLDQKDRVLDGIVFNEPCNYVTVQLPDGSTLQGYFKAAANRCDI